MLIRKNLIFVFFFFLLEKVLFLWGLSDFEKPSNVPVNQSNVLKDEVGGDGVFKIKEISLGRNHIVALSTKKQVLTWGCNQSYALGTNKVALGQVTLKPEILSFEDQVNIICAGECNSAVVTSKGKLYFWGKSFNKRNQDEPMKRKSSKSLSDISIPKRVSVPKKDKLSKVVLGARHLIALSVLGNVYTMGGELFFFFWIIFFLIIFYFIFNCC